MITCQFLFCGQESKQRIFLLVERNLYFLSFLWLNLLILTFVCSSIIPTTHDVIILLKSIFDFLLLLVACPCHEFSRFFMKIICGDYGHIKTRWDNHHNCLKCSSCSRLSTCSTCSTWSEEIWSLADKRRTYAARKSVMTRKRQNKKRRKTGRHSDLSDDFSIDGSITSQGYTARGRTHHGGSLLDAECLKSLSPPGIGHRSPVTGQPGTGQSGTGQPVSQPITGQPGTHHQVTGHQSPVI